MKTSLLILVFSSLFIFSNTQAASLTAPGTFRVYNGLVPHGGTSSGNQHKYRLILNLKDGSTCQLRGWNLDITSRIMFRLKSTSCNAHIMKGLKNGELSHLSFYGRSDGVYIQSIKFYDESSSTIIEKQNFPLNRWVDDDSDDRQMIRPIYPQGDNRITRYEIRVITSTRKKAGTDSRIRLSLIDAFDENSVYNYQPDDKHDNYEKSSVDTFSLYTKTIKNLSEICVSSDGKGDGAGWYPNLITVKDTKNNKIYSFPLRRWIYGGDEICTHF